MKYRVIQWATGGVGRAAIEGIADHPDLELVGCWVHSPEKDGRDAGEIAGRRALGVTATTNAEALLSLDADCVIYSPILARSSEIVRILRSGKNVVTPLGWFYPWKSSDVTAVEAACREARVTMHGTGIHPGGITDRIPLTLSALSRAITHVRAEEFSDLRTYGAKEVLSEIMLFGKTPAEARASRMLTILGAGYVQSIDMIAAGLDVALDRDKRMVHEIAVATGPIESPLGIIEEGRVAGHRFTWEGTVDGLPFVTVRANWLMGEAELDPPWTLGPDGPRFEVDVGGDPPVRAKFHGLHPASVAEGLARNRGVVATAMHCVNAVPYVCRAEPGIKTYLDLPLICGRGAPSLRHR
jgi:hypothetical protein